MGFIMSENTKNWLSKYVEDEPVSVVRIPEGVEGISGWAFNEAKSVKEIIIPASIKGDQFTCLSVERFTVSKDNPYIVDIDGVIYSKNRKTVVMYPQGREDEEYSIPEGVLEIHEDAFRESKLLRVKCPDCLKKIGDRAFYGSKKLESIAAKGAVDIGEDSLLGTKVYELYLTSEVKKIALLRPNSMKISFETSSDTYILPIENIAYGHYGSYVMTFSDEIKTRLHLSLKTTHYIDSQWSGLIDSNEPVELAYILLYQKDKEWQQWFNRHCFDVTGTLNAIECVLSEEKILRTGSINKLYDFVLSYIKSFDRDSVSNLLNTVRSISKDGYNRIANAPEIKQLIGEEDMNPIEEYARKLYSIDSINKSIKKKVKNGVYYNNSERVCSVEVIWVLLMRYLDLWNKLNSGKYVTLDPVTMLPVKMKIDETADHIAEALDSKELTALMEDVYFGSGDSEAAMYAQTMVLARYGDEKTIKNIIKEVSKKSNRENVQAINKKTILLLSDLPEAIKYMESENMISEYAKMRGIKKIDVLNSIELPDFGMDDEGVTTLKLDTNTIQLLVDEDLGIRIIDANTGNKLSAFPSCSGDESIYKKALKQYKTLSESTNSFITCKLRYIGDLYLTGDTISKEIWTKKFYGHPVMRTIVQNLVWIDSTGSSFAINGKQIVDCKDNLYDPTGEIKLAHILDMSTEEIECWQEKLSSLKKKQVIGQMWEIVCRDNKLNPRRYDGCILTKNERNQFKKAMKAKGIVVKSDNQGKSYDRYTNTYSFSDKNVMLIGEYGKIYYTIQKKTGDLILGVADIYHQNKRIINAVYSELDKACAKSIIVNDEPEYLDFDLFKNFNISVINELINFAISCKANLCTAAMLDYKNKAFPGNDWLDELVVDLNLDQDLD